MIRTSRWSTRYCRTSSWTKDQTASLDAPWDFRAAVSRRVKRHRKFGVAGIKHGNTGRPPRNKVAADDKKQVIELDEEQIL